MARKFSVVTCLILLLAWLGTGGACSTLVIPAGPVVGLGCASGNTHACSLTSESPSNVGSEWYRTDDGGPFCLPTANNSLLGCVAFYVGQYRNATYNGSNTNAGWVKPTHEANSYTMSCGWNYNIQDTSGSGGVVNLYSSVYEYQGSTLLYGGTFGDASSYVPPNGIVTNGITMPVARGPQLNAGAPMLANDLVYLCIYTSGTEPSGMVLSAPTGKNCAIYPHD